MAVNIHKHANQLVILFLTLLFTAAVSVACGSSAPAQDTGGGTDTSSAPTAAQPAAAAAPAPAGGSAPPAGSSAPAASGSGSAPAPAPTAVPTPVLVPAGIEISSGMVTIMNAVWGNEYFDPRDQVGEGLNFHRALHAFWVNSNENYELIPGVATDWEISPDGLTWTFTVRDGVTFHDGEELTAEDGAFTWEYMYGPEAIEKSLSPGQSGQARLTEKIYPAEGNTVKITHKEIQANFAFLNAESAPGTTGPIIPDKYFQEQGSDGYNLEPTGAGPFQLVEFRRSEKMLFERFDDHYYHPDNGLPEDRRAKFQTLDMRLVPEASTRVAALRAGDADIIEANVAVRKQVEESGGRIIFGRESTYVWMILQGCQNPEYPCNKRDVRYALDYAIDKEAIMYGLYTKQGACVCGYNYATPSTLGYSTDIDPLPYDPDLARELLAKAGYPDGEGFGTFNIYTWIAGDLPFMPELAQLVADQWKKNLNIDVVVEVGETATVRNRWFNQELYGGVVIRPNEAKYDAGRSVTVYYADFEGRIHFGAMRQDLKDAVTTAKSEIDPDKRQGAYNEMYKQLWDAHYEPSMGHVHLPWGVSGRVTTWDPWPVTPYLSSFWTITLQ